MGIGDKPPISYSAIVAVITLFCTIGICIYLLRLTSISAEPVVNNSSAEVSLVEKSGEKGRKLTTKQLKKHELKKERRQRRAELEEERKEKERQQQRVRELREAQLEEQEKRRAEEEEKRIEEENEAYKEIKGSFSVEQEGNISEGGSVNIDDFKHFIIWKKVTNIMELSTLFALPHKAVAERLQQLEEHGHIFGVLDDRGTYLYITDLEMENLVNYIHKNGRINKQISLEPFCNAAFTLEPSRENELKLKELESRLQLVLA